MVIGARKGEADAYEDGGRNGMGCHLEEQSLDAMAVSAEVNHDPAVLDDESTTRNSEDDGCKGWLASTLPRRRRERNVHIVCMLPASWVSDDGLNFGATTTNPISTPSCTAVVARARTS